MVGLQYLKATYNESDETVVAKWIEIKLRTYFVRVYRDIGIKQGVSE